MYKKIFTVCVLTAWYLVSPQRILRAGLVNYVPHTDKFNSLSPGCIHRTKNAKTPCHYFFYFNSTTQCIYANSSVIDARCIYFWTQCKVYQSWSSARRCTAKSACIIDYTVPIFLTRAVISLQMGHYFLKLICKLNLEISLPVWKEVSRLYGHHKHEYMAAIIKEATWVGTSFFIFPVIAIRSHNMERESVFQ